VKGVSFVPVRVVEPTRVTPDPNHAPELARAVHVPSSAIAGIARCRARLHAYRGA
jgi:hypothetical protein